MVASLITKATLDNDRIEIQLDRTKLFKALSMSELATSESAISGGTTSDLPPTQRTVQTITSGELGGDQTFNDPIWITDAFNHRKRGVESKLILGLSPTAKPDPVLIANIARARDWLSDIHQGRSIADIARAENRSTRQVQRHLEFAFLSPKIIQSITEGTQPPEMTSRQLLSTALPMDWDEQHRLFGMG